MVEVKKSFRVGTRESPLAIKQTNIVLAELAQRVPGVNFELTILSTKGDRDKKTSFRVLNKSGLFTDEVELALLNKEIDFAVHSLKDLPPVLASGLAIVSTPKREEAQDCLILRDHSSLADLPSGAVIGTSSLRREVELLRLRSDLTTASIRGNIDQRLEQLAQGDFAGIILAVAGLKRLGWQNLTGFTVVNFAKKDFLPSIGQAALALECRKTDLATLKLLQQINHHETFQSITAEREFLAAVEAPSSWAIAAYAEKNNLNELNLTGMLSLADGQNYCRVSGSGTDPKILGKTVANQLLNQFKRGL